MITLFDAPSIIGIYAKPYAATLHQLAPCAAAACIIFAFTASMLYLAGLCRNTLTKSVLTSILIPSLIGLLLMSILTITTSPRWSYNDVQYTADPPTLARRIADTYRTTNQLSPDTPIDVTLSVKGRTTQDINNTNKHWWNTPDALLVFNKDNTVQDITVNITTPGMTLVYDSCTLKSPTLRDGAFTGVEDTRIPQRTMALECDSSAMHAEDMVVEQLPLDQDQRDN